MRRGLAAGGSLISATVADWPTAIEVSGWTGVLMRLTRFPEGFYQDGLGQILTERHAGIAHLANQTGMATDQANLLLFSQTHLAEAIDYAWLCRQLFDANYRAGFNCRERAGSRLRATRIRGGVGGLLWLFAHEGKVKSRQKALQGWI